MIKPNQLSEVIMTEKFKQIYNMSVHEFNKTTIDHDRSPQYYWETIMDIVLEPTKEEWETLNE